MIVWFIWACALVGAMIVGFKTEKFLFTIPVIVLGFSSSIPFMFLETILEHLERNARFNRAIYSQVLRLVNKYVGEEEIPDDDEDTDFKV